MDLELTKDPRAELHQTADGPVLVVQALDTQPLDDLADKLARLEQLERENAMLKVLLANVAFRHLPSIGDESGDRTVVIPFDLPHLRDSRRLTFTLAQQGHWNYELAIRKVG